MKIYNKIITCFATVMLMMLMATSLAAANEKVEVLITYDSAEFFYVEGQLALFNIEEDGDCQDECDSIGYGGGSANVVIGTGEEQIMVHAPIYWWKDSSDLNECGEAWNESCDIEACLGFNVLRGDILPDPNSCADGNGIMAGFNEGVQMGDAGSTITVEFFAPNEKPKAEYTIEVSADDENWLAFGNLILFKDGSGAGSTVTSWAQGIMESEVHSWWDSEEETCGVGGDEECDIDMCLIYEAIEGVLPQFPYDTCANGEGFISSNQVGQNFSPGAGIEIIVDKL